MQGGDRGIDAERHAVSRTAVHTIDPVISAHLVQSFGMGVVATSALVGRRVSWCIPPHVHPLTRLHDLVLMKGRALVV